jgi:hypothetical protein
MRYLYKRNNYWLSRSWDKQKESGKSLFYAGGSIMQKPVKEGAIGVFTLEDSGRLYKLESIKSGLYYLRSIDGPLSFKTCLSWHFWPLIDSLP